MGMRRVLLCLSFLISSVAGAQTPGGTIRSLSEMLNEFRIAPEYRASEEQVRAIEYDFESRDIVLEPQLELTAQKYRDGREGYAASPKVLESQLLGMTLRKPFSTGTDIRIVPSWQKAMVPSLDPDTQNNVDWQIGLTQNLWQDGFGRSTRLRRSRETFEKQSQLAAALLQRAQLLIDFENLYWDWAFALRESELRLNNFKRSQEIYSWVRGRYNRSAAEITDLLQAQALMTNRELQVATTRQTLIQAAARMQRYLPNSNVQPNPNELSTERSSHALVTPWKGEELSEPLKLALLQSRGDAEVARVRSSEAREAIRPQLALELIYGKNGNDPESGTAARKSFNEVHEYKSVGLVLRSGLDLGLEYKKVEAARALSEAANQRRTALESEGKVAWKALQDEIRDLNQRIQTARNLVQIQLKKNEAEKKRYRTGRTTAFEAITFEQDAADAEISLWTLYSLLRKAESRARLFAR